MNPLDSNIPARRPCVVEGIDVRALPLGPEEAYVLSRIDGLSTEADIVAGTGLGDERVQQSLARLERLGAIRFEAAPTAQRSKPRARRPVSSGTLPRVRIEEMAPSAAGHPATQLYAPEELNEPADIDQDRKRHILEAYYRLGERTFYEILGVARTADKRRIKAAYFELVNVFHPDRYYGKNLGSFKAKLEKLFNEITVAHDTLTRSARRAEYDVYLSAQDASNSLDRALRDPTAVDEQIEEVHREIEAAARLASESPTATPPPETEAQVTPVVDSAAPQASLPPADPGARRRALARKLSSSPHLGRRASVSNVPKADPSVVRARVDEDLRRLYEQRKQQARENRLAHYVAQADEALRANQPVGALNSLRIAVSLSDDPKLVAQLKDVEKQAYATLAKTYTAQGEYEYKNARFSEAARSFERALLGHASAHLHLRAAQSLIEANENPRGAVEHAREAVALAPQEPTHHITLARAYFAAGLKTSGIGALERAAALAPTNATVQDWLRRARRGEHGVPTPAAGRTEKDE